MAYDIGAGTSHHAATGVVNIYAAVDSNKYNDAVKALKKADASGKYTQDKMAGNSTLKQKYKRFKNAVTGFKKQMEDAELSLRKQQAKLRKFIKEVKERK